MTWTIQTFRWLWALDTRAVEMLFGLFLLARGFVLSVAPGEMSGRSYEPFLDMMPASSWATFFLCVGIIQITGVLINGRWRKSPYVRMGALLATFVAYLGLTLGFSQLSVWLAVSIYAPIAISAFWCMINVSTHTKG